MTSKEKDVLRETKEKKRERRALLSYVDWPISFEMLMFMVGLWNEGSLPFFCAVLWCL